MGLSRFNINNFSVVGQNGYLSSIDKNTTSYVVAFLTAKQCKKYRFWWLVRRGVSEMKLTNDSDSSGVSSKFWVISALVNVFEMAFQGVDFSSSRWIISMTDLEELPLIAGSLSWKNESRRNWRGLYRRVTPVPQLRPYFRPYWFGNHRRIVATTYKIGRCLASRPTQFLAPNFCCCNLQMHPMRRHLVLFQ